FFAYSPEQQGVTALQPHDLLAFPRSGDQERVNLVLRKPWLTAAPADVAHLRPRGDQVKDLLRHEVVVQHYFSALQNARRLHCQQFRIPWTRSYQVNFSFSNWCVHGLVPAATHSDSQRHL